MGIEEALADLATATTSEHLGRQVEINGVVVTCVKSSLKQEEAVSFGGGRFNQDGLAVEGVRLAIDKSLLPYSPQTGGRMTVDGQTYDIRTVNTQGNLLLITLTRFIA
ncbi:MAG: hypothetical protein KJ630_17670 [Proteobacteria bacterium]|nr:hypothetical protein [Pseudomonadota bacterium]